jgi:hypothetical protein
MIRPRRYQATKEHADGQGMPWTSSAGAHGSTHAVTTIVAFLLDDPHRRSVKSSPNCKNSGDGEECARHVEGTPHLAHISFHTGLRVTHSGRQPIAGVPERTNLAAALVLISLRQGGYTWLDPCGGGWPVVPRTVQADGRQTRGARFCPVSYLLSFSSLGWFLQHTPSRTSCASAGSVGAAG